MTLKSFRDDCSGMVDLGVILMIGIAFVGLMVVAYIIFTITDSIFPHVPTGADSHAYQVAYNSSKNITGGFDSAVNLILIAITIFILAVAIGSLLMLRGR